MFIKLNPGIKPINFITYLIGLFWIFSVFPICSSLIPFILNDPKYYNVPDDKLGGDLGTVGSICECIVIVQDIILGFIFDAIGRKIPFIIGLVMTGIGLGLVPLFHKVYPYFLILRIIFYCGSIFGVNCPFLADYVEKNSIGLASFYTSLSVALSSIFVATGLL